MSRIIKKDYNQISLDDFSDDDDNSSRSSSDDAEYGVTNAQRSNGRNTNGSYRDHHHHQAMSNSSSFASSSSNTKPHQRQQQELLFQQQDQGLEMLSKSAERLSNYSMAISDELTAQNQILDDIDTDLETATEQLDFVTRKTKEFIALSGGTKNCILIATLSGIVVLLILLILYT